MCEALVRIAFPTKAALGFTAGILSSFEQLLGVPAEELLATLPLDNELKDASFGRTSPVGRIVRDVIDYQAGQISAARRSGLADLDFDRAAVNALVWALEATASIR